MTRLIKLCLLLSIISPLLGGCWSRHELNEIGIIAGIAIDKSGDEYKVTTQIVNPSRVLNNTGSAGHETPVIAFQETGGTVAEALRRMILTSPRQLYFAHLRMLVIGEKVAKDGIGPALDFLSRNAKTRTDFYIVVSKGVEAANILQIHSRLDPIPTSKLHTMLNTSDRLWAATKKVTLDNLVQQLTTPDRGAILSGVRIIGEQTATSNSSFSDRILSPVNLALTGMAVFRGDHMIGWLDEDDSKAVNYIEGEVKRTVGKLSCPKGKNYVTVEVFNAESDIDVVNRGGMPAFTIHIRVEQNISDVECGTDMTDPSFLRSVNEQAQKHTHMLLDRAIHHSQRELRCDYFGLSEVVHRKLPKLWHSIKKDWSDLYPHVPIEVRVESAIRRAGATSQSIEFELSH